MSFLSFAMPPSPDYTLPLITGRDGELLLKIRAAPGARSDRIVGVHGDALKVAVHAPPDKGKANEALVEVLARGLGVPRSAVSIHGGGASRDKWMRIEGLSRDALCRRLGILLRGA